MLLESVHQMMIYMFSGVNWDSASHQGSDPILWLMVNGSGLRVNG